MRGLIAFTLLAASCTSLRGQAVAHVPASSASRSVGSPTAVPHALSQAVQLALQTATLNVFDSSTRYASLELAWDSFDQLRNELDRVDRAGRAPLQHRGEAHITWLTPPEYQVLLRRLTPARIESILQAHAQEVRSNLKAICVGRFALASSEAWFVVVESAALFKARSEIHLALQEQGGAAGDFDPTAYHPHVTLGFHPRDLHAQDGAIKDSRSCYKAF
ncbi:MAG TPA: hypothetical protein PLZ57_06870 [Pseudobdellovibrionaceae bacterium]|nr:hypothetical protein [Pseudobdellovibrionaceae bacterium]